MSMNNSANGPNGARAQLADYLQANKDALMNEWLARVRQDSVVLSDTLTQLELVDHVPKIFDAMMQALRNHSDETTSDVKEIAARHTVIRWVQRYDLHAVLREVALLRAAFVRQLLAFDLQTEGLENDARLVNAMTIHRILDDIVMDATDTFLQLKDRAEVE
jgi:hypothetical protein